jgi:hypothetical protein
MEKQDDSANSKQSANSVGQAGDPVKCRFGRRSVMIGLGGIAAAAAGAMAFPGLFGVGPARAEEVVVYKSPSCGCCGNWALHLRQSGFDVSIKTIEDMVSITKRAGVPYELESCHTAFVGGYVVEGHVPAQDIHKMLAERPAIKGLAVPGMPASAPGMDSPDHEPYTVYSFDADGRKEVYASY